MIGNIVAGTFSAGVVPSTSSYESIATVSIGAGGSSSQIEFSSIPSTYKHLQLRCIIRDTAAGDFHTSPTAIFNSDTGNNYAWHYLYANGSTVGAGSNTGRDEFGLIVITGSGAGSNVYASSVIDILDYTSTSKYKTVRTMSAADNNGSGEIYFNSGLWLNTAAISNIKISAVSSITQYSTFALYGIKD